jgi:hypothetical protein
VFVRYLVTCLLLIPALQAFSQNDASENTTRWGMAFTGFIKNDFWFDTRQVFTSREDLFLFYPKNAEPDRDGRDVNKGLNYNFSAMTTRLTGIIKTPDVLGAKMSGILEGDFSGVTNNDINGFRLRHALMQMKWNKAEILVGQFWHPFFTTDVVPNMASLNTGAPFQPFIRNPQIRLTGVFTNFRIEGAFITQRDNSSDGPDGFSPQYMRNAVFPNASLLFQFKNTHHAAGLGADYKVLQPRLMNDSLRITHSKIASLSFVGYYKFSKEKFTCRLKSIYGQNLTEHLMLGGYAIQRFDTASGNVAYTPTNHLFAWMNITYGKKFMGGLFAGYAKNFGTSSENTGDYFSRGADIDCLYRIAPSISYTENKFQLLFETEYTVAAYGTPDDKGIVQNTKEIGNLRLLLTAFYFF